MTSQISGPKKNITREHKKMITLTRHSHRKLAAVLATAIIGIVAAQSAARAEWANDFTTSVNNYLDTNNWVGGIIDDVVTKDANNLNLVLEFPADHSTAGDIRVRPTASVHVPSVTLRGSGGNRTLTLNGNFYYDRWGHGAFYIGSTTAGQHLNVDLGGGTRKFIGLNGDQLYIRNDITNGSLQYQGAGNETLHIESATSYTGSTEILSGTALRIKGAASTGQIIAGSSTIFLQGAAGTALNADVHLRGGRLQLGNGSGNNNNRIGDTQTVYLESGGSLYLDGVNNGSTTETIGVKLNGVGSLQAHHGTGAADTAILTANLDRELRSVLHVAGTTLGASSGAFSQIIFPTAPAVYGGGGGSGATNISIVPWLYGGGSGSYTFGTYNQAGFTGVGLLDTTTEYVTGTATGNLPAANNDDNVRVTFNSNGILSLTGDRTVNSLVLIGLGGNQVNGAGHTLAIDSGGLLVQTHNNPFSLNVSTIDFGSSEGVINLAQDGGLNGRLIINSQLTGNNGVTLRASKLNTTNGGQIVLAGNNTYSGLTTVPYGRVVTSGNERIPDGGTITLGPSAELAVGAGNIETVAGLSGTGAFRLTDTASQLIVGGGSGNGGAVTMNAGGSVSPGHSIGTLNIGDPDKADSVDFMMTGGALDIEVGPDGIDILNVTGDATINGGTLNLTFLDGFFPEKGETYTFLTATSVSGSLFSTINAPTFMYTAVEGSSIITFTPEPATVTMLGLLAIGLAARRPRHNRSN